MKTTGALLFALLLLLLPAIALADETAKDTAAAETGHAGWYADFDEAAKVAKEQGKDLLVDFTGSDWCVWCMRLKQEVFDHAEFSDAATKRYVLVALDFPRSEEAKAKVPNPARNQELVQKYKIRGYPTVLLMTPDGDVFGQTGYKAGGPTPYVEMLTAVADKGKTARTTAEELQAKYEGATAEEKTAIRKQALAFAKDLPAEVSARQPLLQLAQKALTAEGVTKEEKTEVVKTLLENRVGSEEVFAAAREVDPSNEAGLFEQAVMMQVMMLARQQSGLEPAVELITELDAMGEMKDKQIAAQLYLIAASIQHQHLSNLEEAKKWAQKALDAGVENARAKQYLEQIVGS